ncbi:MarR family winged helix-turn-helix transcriptional regulator [Stigmatella aurantiaca]|nr:MarR family transcriptional regulator [Stigmatella aurantiaca]ADO69996.1 Transcriptional regulator, MarR family [Stigmatella aurantiaca DW4/3-1]
MPRRAPGPSSVSLDALDLGHLALFVGMRVNDLVLEEMHAAGFQGLRHAHGFVFQHLLGGARSIGELAALMEVTQQATSKTIAELEKQGFVEEVASGDARVRRIRLSARGLAAVELGRAVRAEFEQRFAQEHSPRAVKQAKELLASVLTSLGGADTVRRRRVKMPR